MSSLRIPSLRRRHMPSLGGAGEWLNSPALSGADLTGRVVLVDFWTLTCINWLRTVPYVRAWADAYHDEGLIVIGVHTPEFSFEHDIDLVRQASRARAIDYPIAIDNDAVWRAFDNHYWPALYLVDTDTVIRDRHFGEGRYEESERTIQRLLGIDRALVSVDPTGVEAQADWDHMRSPETYLGFDRGERFGSPGGVAFDRQATYALPENLPVHHWALDGSWTIAGERVALGSADGGIAYRFEARDAHLVLDGSADGTPFRVLLDGERPGPAHGMDVDEEGRGVLREGRLYNLIRVPSEVRERTVQITFEEPGVRAYVFTFG